MVRRSVPRLLVVAVCAAALVQGMWPAVHSARIGELAILGGADLSGRAAREQLEYITAELARQVPAGTRTSIVADSFEWRVRLTQLATLDGIVVVDGPADLEIRLMFDPAAPHGARIVASRPVPR